MATTNAMAANHAKTKVRSLVPGGGSEIPSRDPDRHAVLDICRNADNLM
jgi:hypothetical protein